MAIDKTKGFQSVQLAYRLQFLELMKRLETEYSAISNELQDRIQAVINKYANDGILNKTDLSAIQGELDGVALWFSTNYGKWLDDNLARTIDIAVLGQDTASMYFVKRMIAERQIAAGLESEIYKKVLVRQQYGTGLNNAIRQGIWNQRWSEDNLKLSDRIWKTDANLRANLKAMIEQCVNEGRSAVEFSKAVEEYLKNPGKRWTTQIKPSVTGRGSLDYQSLRLARSEINAAYHQATNIAAINNPMVRGVKFNLSRSHPRKDICDIWASQDIHGLGPGIYRSGESPREHPNGLCFLTLELFKGQQLTDILKQKYQKLA